MHRKKYVEFEDTKLDLLPITTGVLKGSILSPLLFSIHINDIYMASTLLTFIVHADDTTLLFSLVTWIVI